MKMNFHGDFGYSFWEEKEEEERVRDQDLRDEFARRALCCPSVRKTTNGEWITLCAVLGFVGWCAGLFVNVFSLNQICLGLLVAALFAVAITFGVPSPKAEDSLPF